MCYDAPARHVACTGPSLALALESYAFRDLRSRANMRKMKPLSSLHSALL